MGRLSRFLLSALLDPWIEICWVYCSWRMTTYITISAFDFITPLTMCDAGQTSLMRERLGAILCSSQTTERTLHALITFSTHASWVHIIRMWSIRGLGCETWTAPLRIFMGTMVWGCRSSIIWMEQFQLRHGPLPSYATQQFFRLCGSKGCIAWLSSPSGLCKRQMASRRG